jgi:hypothetical protein
LRILFALEDVTRDSIAAWVAGAVGARRLVLIKPPGRRLRDQADSFGGATPGATGSHVVDAYFPRALPAHVISLAVAADDADALRSALGGDVEPA